jgi:hypothetical protein
MTPVCVDITRIDPPEFELLVWPSSVNETLETRDGTLATLQWLFKEAERVRLKHRNARIHVNPLTKVCSLYVPGMIQRTMREEDTV